MTISKSKRIFTKRRIKDLTKTCKIVRKVCNLTIGQAKAVEEDLAKKQQNFRLYQQSVEQEVVNDQAKLQGELYGKITAFLKKYAEGSELQVVMKFDQTS